MFEGIGKNIMQGLSSIAKTVGASVTDAAANLERKFNEVLKKVMGSTDSSVKSEKSSSGSTPLKGINEHPMDTFKCGATVNSWLNSFYKGGLFD